MSETYEKKINDIIEYYKINGHLPLLYHYDEKVKSMCSFLYNEKKRYKCGKLSKYKIDLLNTIPTYNVSKTNGKKYINYKKKINKIAKTKKLSKYLEKFIKEQITNFHNLSTYKQNLLFNIPEIKKKLDKVNTIKNLSYDEKIDMVIKYYNKYKKLPSSYNLLYKDLGLFLHSQKQLYKNEKITIEKYTKLCKIPTFEERLNS